MRHYESERLWKRKPIKVDKAEREKDTIVIEASDRRMKCGYPQFGAQLWSRTRDPLQPSTVCSTAMLMVPSVWAAFAAAVDRGQVAHDGVRIWGLRRRHEAPMILDEPRDHRNVPALSQKGEELRTVWADEAESSASGLVGAGLMLEPGRRFTFMQSENGEDLLSVHETLAVAIRNHPRQNRCPLKKVQLMARSTVVPLQERVSTATQLNDGRTEVDGLEIPVTHNGVQLDLRGMLQKRIEGLRRPMHIR